MNEDEQVERANTKRRSKSKRSQRINKGSLSTLQEIVTLAMEGFVAQVLNSHGNDLLQWEFFK